MMITGIYDISVQLFFVVDINPWLDWGNEMRLQRCKAQVGHIEYFYIQVALLFICTQWFEIWRYQKRAQISTFSNVEKSWLTLYPAVVPSKNVETDKIICSKSKLVVKAYPMGKWRWFCQNKWWIEWFCASMWPMKLKKMILLLCWISAKREVLF